MLNTETNFSSAQDVAERVISSRGYQGGFALARFGHCESRIMGFSEFSSRSEVDKSLRLQLGRDDLSDEEVGVIAQLMRNAYKECDFIGLGNFSQLDPSKKLSDNELYLNSLLEKIPEMASHFGLQREMHQFCSSNIHLELLRSEYLRNIISCFDDILIISCRDLTKSFHLEFGTLPRQIFIPQEHRTTGLYTDIVSAWHYPDVFNKVMTQINETVSTNTLVLIGAGFLGKIYGMAAKRSGGVALDLGSVFDVWAGVRSRSGFSPELYTKYVLNGTSDEPEIVSYGDSPARKDTSVGFGERRPIWQAKDVTEDFYSIAGKPGGASFKQDELFIHSSPNQFNSISFIGLNLSETTAIALTILVGHTEAAPTRFTIQITLSDGVLNFSKVCGPDDSLHWLQFLPVGKTVDSIRVSTSPADPSLKSSYGWCYIRGLRLY